MSTRKVLVIDDDRSCQKVVEKLMGELGFTTYSFTEWSSSTIQQIIDICPDVILLDECLIGVRGSDLCVVLKSINQLRTTPVILISGIHDLADVARKCSANSYIEKPLTPTKLEDTVKVLFKAA